MCRLLGVVTSDVSALSQQVPGVLAGFCELANKHRDGWGVAWRDTQNKLRVEHDTQPACHTERFPQVINEVVSDISLVHLRRASPGSPIVLENCHPFIEGEIAFGHNGQLPVSERLLTWAEANGVRPRNGSTDSEFFFGLILHYAKTLDWPEAIAAAARQITEDMQLSDPFDAPESLNLLLTTPDALYAFTQSNPKRRSPTALPNEHDLRIRQRDGEVIITSSQWDLPDTTVIDWWHVVEVSRNTLTVTYHAFSPPE